MFVHFISYTRKEKVHRIFVKFFILLDFFGCFHRCATNITFM